MPTLGEVELSTFLLPLSFFNQVNVMTRIIYTKPVVKLLLPAIDAMICYGHFLIESQIFTRAVLIILLSLSCGLQQC